MELTDKNEKEELTFLHNTLKQQELMFQNPDNNFSLSYDLLNKSAQEKRNNKEYTGGFGLVPAFGHILRYGIIKPKTRKEKAEIQVNRAATLAAGESALLLQVSTTLETSALTATTTRMCYQVCKTYHVPAGAVSSIIAQVSGNVIGKAAASWVLKWFPGAGNLANATITYGLHQITGRTLIKFCESNYDNPNIETYNNIAKFGKMLDFAFSIGGNPLEKMGYGEIQETLININR